MHNPTDVIDNAARMAALICENAVLARQLAAVQMRCPLMTAPSPAQLEASAQPTPPPARQQKRKLHQLPASAQDMLLALSLTPLSLRAEIQRALSKLHAKPVRLQGSDADVLYSAMHDLNARNVLSEALHRRLQARHGHAVQRLTKLRDADALRQAWLYTLHNAKQPLEEIPAQLWAVLTHALGPTVETSVLAEARWWILTQARSAAQAAATQHSHASSIDALKAELDHLRLRLQAQQRSHEQALAQARQCAHTYAGQMRYWQAAAQQAGQPKDAAVETPSPAAQAMAPPPRRAASPCAQPATQASADARQKTAVAMPGRSAEPARLQGQRVLCVGGIQHAVARYRSRIESLGGRFEHHDGGLHDNAHALDGRLARADLVICQAGCINHAAYHRIKRHCQKSGTPCLYLERASLSRFDLALRRLDSNAAPAQTTRPA